MRYRRRTPAQIAASRRNGARSRGPVTPEGRQTASLNLQGPPPDASFIKAAKSILIPGESESDFVRLSAFFLNRFDPEDPLEAMLVQRMLVAQWQMLRVWGFERLAIIAAPEQDTEDPAVRCYTNFLGLQTKSRVGNSLQASAHRYQRQFDQAYAQLERMRANVSFMHKPQRRSKETTYAEFPEPTPNPGNPETDPSSTHASPATEDDVSEPQA